MTEQEWFRSTVLGDVRSRACRDHTPRTKLLWACACCRFLYWSRLPSEVRAALEVAERSADGAASEQERHLARTVAIDYWDCLERPWREAGSPSPQSPSLRAAWFARGAIGFGVAPSPQCDVERAAQCHFAREILGNNFHFIALDDAWWSWQQGAVRQMAQGIYDGRSFEDMPILGDLLDDAGCASEVILRHCRDPGPHVRGCWILDLLLREK